MNIFLQFSNRQRWVVFLIVIGSVLLWIFDAVDDLAHGSSWAHLGVEAVIVAFATIWILSVVTRDFASKKKNMDIKETLKTTQKDLENYKSETLHLIKGLSQKIDVQFAKWGMTRAEKEVALLILKGLTNKEIADVRGTSEKTVVQQASSVYAKSGLRSRGELSAFFLEDLFSSVSMPPVQARD